MNSKLAIELSTALIADDRLFIDVVDDSENEHVEDLVADIIDKQLKKLKLAGNDFSTWL